VIHERRDDYMNLLVTEDDLRLRRVAIYVILGVIVTQVIFVNVVFVIYLVKNNWRL
jgi:hypothetical protein